MGALGSPKDAEAIFDMKDQLGIVLGPVAEGAAKEVVQNSHEIPTKVGKPVYEWVPLDMETKLVPENALLAAKDRGNPVYVGRGMLDGSIRLGKYHEKYGKLFVSHLGEEKELTKNIEILCVDKDAKVEWVDCKNGVIPTGAIVGTIVDGKSEYVGKGMVRSQITPGRIVPEDKCMYVPYGGKDNVLTECKALVIQNGKPLYQWVPVDNWVLPKNAIPVAMDASDSWDIYVGRASLHNRIRMGKVHTGYKKLYVAHCGKEEEIVNLPFEVLCADEGAKVEWKDFENGKIPTEAVLGSIVDGRIEFVGRGVTKSAKVSLGQIVPADGCMYVPYGGKSETLTKYQVLVIQ